MRELGIDLLARRIEAAVFLAVDRLDVVLRDARRGLRLVGGDDKGVHVRHRMAPSTRIKGRAIVWSLRQRDGWAL